MTRSALWLAGIAAGGVAAVAAALVSQHVYGMQPCPWCVLQRAIFLAIAIAAVAGLLLRGALRQGAVAAVLLLAVAGLAAALWQHFVAAASASCNMTLAERVISALTLDEHWPQVFMATASCADAKVDLFGLPYEAWSGALFTLALVLALRLLLARPRLVNAGRR